MKRWHWKWGTKHSYRNEAPDFLKQAESKREIKSTVIISVDTNCKYYKEIWVVWVSSHSPTIFYRFLASIKILKSSSSYSIEKTLNKYSQKSKIIQYKWNGELLANFLLERLAQIFDWINACKPLSRCPSVKRAQTLKTSKCWTLTKKLSWHNWTSQYAIWNEETRLSNKTIVFGDDSSLLKIFDRDQGLEFHQEKA